MKYQDRSQNWDFSYPDRILVRIQDFRENQDGWTVCQNQTWTGITEFKALNPVRPWIFSGFLFASQTMMILFYLTLHSSVHIYHFNSYSLFQSYFHEFTIIQLKDQLPASLLAQLVEHYTSITEFKGSNPKQTAWIVSVSFSQLQKLCLKTVMIFLHLMLIIHSSWRIMKSRYKMIILNARIIELQY